MMKSRLISKEQVKIVAGTGGVIGIWTHLADTPLAYAQNVRALVDVIGIDHVCIGTDTKPTPAYRPGSGLGDPQTGKTDFLRRRRFGQSPRRRADRPYPPRFGQGAIGRPKRRARQHGLGRPAGWVL